jgi:hypothetical protein
MMLTTNNKLAIFYWQYSQNCAKVAIFNKPLLLKTPVHSKQKIFLLKLIAVNNLLI